MIGTPGSGSRRDKVGQPPTTSATPRNGIATSKTTSNGRVTPVRIRNGESGFVNANTAWGFETPSNKILSNIPSTVTIRSSERRRRVKTDASDGVTSGDKPLGPGFVDSKFARVRPPTPDAFAPRMLERSDSNASAKSDRSPRTRKLAKVSSFCSDRPLTTPLQPTNKKDNFFHAKDYKEKSSKPRNTSEKFFFAINEVKGSPSIPPLTTSGPRRLSNSSQSSAFPTAKEVCTNNNAHYSIPPPANPLPQPRSPVSPTKSTFFQTSSSTVPTSPTFQKTTPSSPLRSAFVIAQTPSATQIQSSENQISLSDSLTNDTSTSNSSSLTSSAPIEVSSNTSEDEITTKSLLPSTADLENSARINRKVLSHFI
jgi:hypothetical protein